ALHADLVVMESKGIEYGKHDTSSSSGIYITHAVDADIRPVNDQVPFAEVQLIAQHNVLANEHQHTKQSEPIYDTYLLEIPLLIQQICVIGEERLTRMLNNIKQKV
ncbi:hypothetical protein Tco_0467202, partial [Tanacetum coccineum]